MKKYIYIIAIAICACACSPKNYTTYTYGDIYLLNNSGDKIYEWDNSTMEINTVSTDGVSYYKENKTVAIKDGGGLLFSDKYGETHYVNGGIIIVDNIRSSSKEPQSVQKDKNDIEREKEGTINEYKRLKGELKNHKAKVKKVSKDSEEYTHHKTAIKKIESELKKLENKLWTRWSIDYRYVE